MPFRQNGDGDVEEEKEFGAGQEKTSVSISVAEEDPEFTLAEKPRYLNVKNNAALFTKAAQSARNVSKKMAWTVDPMTSKFANFWDGVLSAGTLFTAIVTPAEVGFIDNVSLNWIFFCNQLVNAIFVFDLCFNFFLHYQLANDDWVRDHGRIIRHYLRTNFCIDLLVSFPFELIYFFGGGHESLRGMRLLRIIRIVKLLRLMRTSRLVHRYRADLSLSFGFMNVAFFVVASILSAHWIACAWGAAGRSSSVENSWMAAFRDQDDDPAWSINAPKNQYLISLYFSIMTLTTVGYGDVGPKNLSEYALLVFAMLLGGFLWAYIIGAVCGSVANLDRVKMRHQQRYDQINNLLVREQITWDLASKIRSYLFQTEEVDRHVAYAGLMTYLSPMLQQELAKELLEANVSKVHYLRRRSLPFKMAIFRKLETKLFCPDEKLQHRDLIVIVNNGSIQTYQETWIVALRGDALNLDFILRSHFHRSPTMRSLSYTEVNILSRDDLDDVCLHFPKEKTVILWMRAFYAVRNCLRFHGIDALRRLTSGSSLSDSSPPPHLRSQDSSPAPPPTPPELSLPQSSTGPHVDMLTTTNRTTRRLSSSSDTDSLRGTRSLRTTAALAMRRSHIGGRPPKSAQRNAGDVVVLPGRHKHHQIDDLKRGLAAAQNGDLTRCSPRLRDVQILVDMAIAHSDATAFEFASDRLRADPHVVRHAVRVAGSHWRNVVLPHTPQPLRDLLTLVSEEAEMDLASRRRSSDGMDLTVRLRHSFAANDDTTPDD